MPAAGSSKWRRRLPALRSIGRPARRPARDRSGKRARERARAHTCESNTASPSGEPKLNAGANNIIILDASVADCFFSALAWGELSTKQLSEHGGSTSSRVIAEKRGSRRASAWGQLVCVCAMEQSGAPCIRLQCLLMGGMCAQCARSCDVSTADFPCACRKSKPTEIYEARGVRR